MRLLSTSKSVAVLATMVILIAAAAAQSRHCTPVGGMLMTNLGAVDPATTMGVATGDLKGAVGATILSKEGTGEGTGSTLILHVQHHWVTESGDTLFFAPATATTTQVGPDLYAMVTYPVHLNGGTGKFAGATGDITNIGEADLGTNRVVTRYIGQICYAGGIRQ
jgi:hypothetical protein